MKEKEFMELMRGLDAYLSMDKIFAPNNKRLADVKKAYEIATTLFGDMDITLKDDALKLGSVVLSITGSDLVARGESQIALFNALTEKADNFEIYAVNKNNVIMSIMFKGVFTRIKTK